MLRLADMSYEMVTKMEFLAGNVTFHQHPVAPCFKYLKAGGMFSLFRDGADLHMAKRLWGIRSWERAPGRAALLADKDRSVELADEGVRMLEGEFIRCGAAYVDDMDVGSPEPRRLAAAVAAADAEISSMMSNPGAGAEGLNIQHSEAVGQNLDRAYFIPLRWLCREYLNEYAAESRVRARLKARRDVADFVVPGGIYDDNRVDRPMHGAYAKLVDGVPVRRVGNAIFPNGTIVVEFRDVPGAWVEVELSPDGAQTYALGESVADGVRRVVIGKKGVEYPAVVSVALVVPAKTTKSEKGTG